MASLLARALNLNPPDDPAAAAFVDIADSFHEDSIRAIAHHGITYGCDVHGFRYCPDLPASRAQIASLMARAFNLKPPANPTAVPFVGIKGNTHADNIRAVTFHGIAYGCDVHGFRYCPDLPASRAQVASFLARALKL